MIHRTLSYLFAILAALAAAAGIYFSISRIDAEPVLVKQPSSAQERVVTLMDAVCASDYKTVSAQLCGQPDLGLDREAADAVGVLLWDALEDSRSYTIVSDCYATNTGVAWDIQLTCLDLSSVTANLREHSQALLAQRVEEAEDISEIYDENNEYREEFVMDVLYDAAVEALAEDAEQTTYSFTLNLICANGVWWVMPDAPLLQAISGGILN
ncbi:MAG: hypothetical protein J6L24_07310 [Oscillospiraceae bacterium]|nr:hypothetical protein [Oscillospiraceae bacterium]